MIKPVGNRTVLKCDITVDKENNEIISPEAKVIDSNSEELSKGDTVFFNQYGAVSVNSLKTKKNIVLIVDNEDIYGLLK